MTTDISVLLRSMKQLVPNPETSAILSVMGVTYWAYDLIAEEICWQCPDATNSRGYRLAKFSIQQALQDFAQPDRKKFLQIISDAVEHGLSPSITATMNTETGRKTFAMVAALLLGKSRPLVIGVMRESSLTAPGKIELPNFLPGLAHALASASSAILVTDRKGVVRSANHQFLKVFSVKNARQIIGRDVRTIPNLVGKKLAASFTEVFAENTVVQDTLKQPQETGVITEMSFVLQPLALENAIGGCIFVGEVDMDPLELPVAEILDAVPTPILMVDLTSSRIKYANRAGRGELGLSAGQLGKECLSDKLLTKTDVRDLTSVIEQVGWDAGRVWQVQSHIGLKRHYRIRTGFIGNPTERQIILEFLPVRKETDKPANEKAKNFFARLLNLNLAR